MRDYFIWQTVNVVPGDAHRSNYFFKFFLRDVIATLIRFTRAVWQRENKVNMDLGLSRSSADNNGNNY